MTESRDTLAARLFSEILATEHLTRSLAARSLPRGFELSQLLVLEHLGRLSDEPTPAQLADRFHLTRGAMTNTLQRMEAAGWVHIRPDWSDARKKRVSISPAGEQACAEALRKIAPQLVGFVDEIGAESVQTILPVLRRLRERLVAKD